MARIRSEPRRIPFGTRSAMVEAIVKAIKNEPQQDAPVIFEINLGETDYYQIIVVWSRWSDLSADVRTRIVTEAYEQACSENVDAINIDKISMILPVTAQQAVEMDLLPYVLQRSDGWLPEGPYILKELLDEEGAIEVDGRIELRLPSLDMAKAAKDRLEQRTNDLNPPVHWQIARQIGQVIDY